MKKIINITIGVLVILLVMTQITSTYIANTNAVESIDVTELQDKIAKLEESNMQLEAEVLKYASYVEVASRAAELGYEKSSDIITVYDPVKVAIR